MFQFMQNFFTFKNIWKMIQSMSHQFLQDRLVAAWSEKPKWDSFMDRHSVIDYIVESTIMDTFDDMREYAINPWYHPVASFKQLMGPLVRFFWEVFGTSPVFWLILAVWVTRRTFPNYDEYYEYLAEIRTAAYRRWTSGYRVSPDEYASTESSPTPSQSAEDSG